MYIIIDKIILLSSIISERSKYYRIILGLDDQGAENHTHTINSRSSVKIQGSINTRVSPIWNDRSVKLIGQTVIVYNLKFERCVVTGKIADIIQ